MKSNYNYNYSLQMIPPDSTSLRKKILPAAPLPQTGCTTASQGTGTGLNASQPKEGM
jgi:hypothetical protein